jgi:SAM-dependent methyltransferase
MTGQLSRSESYGQRRLTPVDRLGVWLSHRRIVKSLPKSAGLEVLDCGCGYRAEILLALQPCLRRGVGIDICIDPALKSGGDLEFIESTLEDALPVLAAESFDVVLVISVLEHLTAPQETLAHCHRLLRPGGCLLVNVPTWLGKRFLEFSAFRLGLSPACEIDDHRMYFDKRDIWPALVRAGFKPSRLKLTYYKFGLNLFGVCQKK